MKRLVAVTVFVEVEVDKGGTRNCILAAKRAVTVEKIAEVGSPYSMWSQEGSKARIVEPMERGLRHKYFGDIPQKEKKLQK